MPLEARPEALARAAAEGWTVRQARQEVRLLKSAGIARQGVIEAMLKAAGLTSQDASRMETVASVEEEVFEAELAECRKKQKTAMTRPRVGCVR